MPTRQIRFRVWNPHKPWGPAYFYPDVECGRPGHVKYGDVLPQSAIDMGAKVPIVHGPGCGSDSLIVEMTLNGEPILFGGKMTEGCVLEQWTELTDKNGKDVYEGDVVYGVQPPDTFCQGPVPRNHTGRVVWAAEYGQWMIAGEYPEPLYPLWQLTEAVVVGNVHESVK